MHALADPPPPAKEQLEAMVVDLDGTLLRTDLFIESILALLRSRPALACRLPFWLLRGRAYAKEQVAQRVRVDTDALPMRPAVVELVHRARAESRQTVLATAAHRTQAQAIADATGLFDAVLASDRGTNLKGEAKAAAIRSLLGGKPYIYAGDNRADLPVWKCADGAIVVGARPDLIRHLQNVTRVCTVIEPRRGVWRAGLRALRPHQWIKNLLVLVPLFTAHAYANVSALWAAGVAFVTFTLVASGAYLLNDLMDLEADRRHREKRHRPLASGELPLVYGLGGAAALPAAGLGLAVLALPPAFALLLAAYYLLTVAYSLALKSHSTIDVMTLGALYSLRVAAGAAAIEVTLSPWLMAFSMFLFMSLAYAKRYIEVASLDPFTRKTAGRNYAAQDADGMYVLGIAHMTAAVLIMSLYISDDAVRAAYAHPDLLWGVCLALLFWGNRFWLGAKRGKISQDPVSFALRDRISVAIGILAVAVVVAAHGG